MSSISATYKRLSTSQKFMRRFSLGIKLVIAVILVIFAIFPVLWVISASLDPTSQLGSQSLIPPNASLVNFQKLFNDPLLPFWTWILNSVKISGITTILSLTITTMAAYAFSRLRFKGRINMLKAIMLIQVFPNLLALVAIYLMIQQTGSIIPWLGLETHAGLILVYLGGSMGINIWLMKGFLDTIPRAIDEAAMLDGASNWQIFTLLLLPLLRPILVVVGILSFIGTYGDFILARILLSKAENYTFMVGLTLFTGNQFAQNWGEFSAGALIGALPIMIIYLALQDKIAGGLTTGAVKE
jgi:arabinogalactan oligomer / maltooligosaccharide transport system permease protein